MSNLPMPRTRAKALVKLIVEIEVESVWGEDCPTGQIYREATSEALDALRSGIRVNGIANNLTNSKLLARLVGEPEVLSIIAKKE